MSTAVATRTLTVDEFLNLPDYDRYELVDGEPKEDMVSFESSWVGGQALHRIAGHLDDHPLGWVLGADQLFRLWPDSLQTMRKPDVAFVPYANAPRGPTPEPLITAVPALVVEVSSPSNTADDLDLKVVQFLEVGVRLVWVIYPRTRMAQVFRADGSTTRLQENDDLDGEDVLPGFKCRLSTALPPRQPGSPS